MSQPAQPTPSHPLHLVGLRRSLASITIPNSITNIGDYAFGSTDLTNLMIPNSVAGIGIGAFNDNTNLTSITIPSSVTILKDSAFEYCYSLTNVCFEGDAPTNFGSLIFANDPLPVIVYVSGATGWGSNYEGIPTAVCAQCDVAVIGALQVNINPPCAVMAGAQWQVDGGVWQNSGVIVTNLAGGNHTVSFTNIVGWLAPINQTVLVTAATTNTAAGNYIETSTPGTVTWIHNGGNVNWNNPANWDLNRAPTTNDIVLIPYTQGTNCSLDVDTSVAGLVIGDCPDGGSDSLNLNGHILTVNGPITIKSNTVFGVNSGALVGNSNTIISGVIGWTSGTLAGTLTLASNCVLNLSTTTYSKNLNCVLTNYGTVNWSGDQLNGGGVGAVVYNYGLWNARDDQDFNGAGSVFNNYGTFRKSGGIGGFPGTLFVPGVLFNQAGGILDVQSGTNGLYLTLQGGGNFTGGYVTTNSTGVILLNSGSFNINGTTTSRNVYQSSASLVGTNVIKGTLTWQNGPWNGVITVSSNSVLIINSTTYNKTFNGCLVTNYGTVNWSGDQLNGNNGTVIYNYGLWTAQDDQYFYGYSGMVFNNYGTFRKSGGADAYPGTLFSSGSTFNQMGGVMDMQIWYLTSQGACNLTNGTLSFGINDPAHFGHLILGSLTLGGVLRANVSGNFAPAVGEQFGVIGSSALNGTFSSVNVPAGISVVYTNSSVVLNVTGPVPVQLLDPQLVGTNLFFQFPTVSGQSYTIQWNDVLTSTNWVYYTNINGSGSLYQFQVPATVTPAQRFFRVRQP